MRRSGQYNLQNHTPGFVTHAPPVPVGKTPPVHLVLHHLVGVFHFFKVLPLVAGLPPRFPFFAFALFSFAVGVAAGWIVAVAAVLGKLLCRIVRAEGA